MALTYSYHAIYINMNGFLDLERREERMLHTQPHLSLGNRSRKRNLNLKLKEARYCLTEYEAAAVLLVVYIDTKCL